MQNNKAAAMTNIFHYKQLPVRTVTIAGEPWFVAGDVCDILELTNTTKTIRGLDDDEKGLTIIQSLGGNQETNIVSESGLYCLILRSRKPEAKLFKRWVTHDVLPALRTTGSYSMNGVPYITRRQLLSLAVAAENECDALREQVQVLAPKGEFYDRVLDSPSTFSLAETAKILGYEGFGRNNLIRFLRDEGILMLDNVAKQRYIDRGYFELVQHDYAAPDGTTHIRAVTRVKEKGVDYIRRRLEGRLNMLGTQPAIGGTN